MCGLAAVTVLVGSAAPVPADRNPVVTVRFLGGADKVPLDGLAVTIRAHTGDWSADRKRKLMAGTTGKTGAATFALRPGRYYVDVDSEKERPYLRHPAGHKGNSPYYNRVVTVGTDAAQVMEFNLADACKLVLRAVDADTGAGVPGVGFATENALGEIWAMDIDGDNLGAKPLKGADGLSDRDGSFTRLIGPRPGYTYFPWTLPKGYERVDGREVELPSPVGTDRVEHVFKVRKKK